MKNKKEQIIEQLSDIKLIHIITGYADESDSYGIITEHGSNSDTNCSVKELYFSFDELRKLHDILSKLFEKQEVKN